MSLIMHLEASMTKTLNYFICEILTFSYFRLAMCSLQKYPEISYYHDNVIMIMTFHDYSG